MGSNKINFKIFLTILVVTLGYFVDIYDLILFSVVRVPSLKDLGLSDEEILSKGILLLNLQMIGMLIGGILFGVWADKKGRLGVLYASILLYSIATLLNAFVSDVTTYAILRFIAGVGLAGELGIGVTLVSELMPKEKRGYGTTVIATLGMCGALVAWPVAKHFDWRTAYILGGVMGLVLLVLRLGILESNLFKKASEQKVEMGNFLALFTNRTLFFKFLACTFIAVQLWYIVGVLITLSPEFTRGLGLSQNIEAGEAVFYCYLGVILGGFLSGMLSQYLKSRKKAIIAFAISSTIGIIGYFFLDNISSELFYFICFLLGITCGYWSLFVQVSAEQFGTNIRATATTAITNFGRATVVPFSILFHTLKQDYGLIAGLWVGLLSAALSLIPIFYLKETFHKDLDYYD